MRSSTVLVRGKQNGAARGARIGDVAREAGVSTATVSRALAHPAQVSKELRERVGAAVAKLGYTPNAAARQLRVKRSRTVLVVTRRRWSAPFFAEVLRGLDAELSAAGYAMVLANFDGDGGNRSRQLVDMMFSGTIEGAVMLSGIVVAAEGRTMLDAGLPLVSLCAAAEGTHTVLTNEAECIVEGARRLAVLGHTDFLYLAGPPSNYNERVRWAALSAFFADPRQAGLRLRRAESGDFSTDGGLSAAQAFLGLSPRPTAVIASADEIAIGFMKAVRAAGIGVPSDVSVLGFDGIEFADFCEPVLSTIRQPREALGRLGARVLIEAIEAPSLPPLSHHVLPSRLDFRASTGPAPPGGASRGREAAPAPKRKGARAPVPAPAEGR